MGNDSKCKTQKEVETREKLNFFSVLPHLLEIIKLTQGTDLERCEKLIQCCKTPTDKGQTGKEIRKQQLRVGSAFINTKTQLERIIINFKVVERVGEEFQLYLWHFFFFFLKDK